MVKGLHMYVAHEVGSIGQDINILGRASQVEGFQCAECNNIIEGE